MYWIKHFADGSCERGDEKDILAGTASWSKGRLDGLKKVEVVGNGCLLSLEGIGEYWQADGYIVASGAPKPIMVKRFVQKRIEVWDKAFIVQQTKNTVIIKAFDGSAINPKYIMPVLQKDVGCWITAEIDFRSNAVSCYVSDKRA